MSDPTPPAPTSAPAPGSTTPGTAPGRASGTGRASGRGAGDELSRLAAATLLASFDGPEVPDWLRRRVDDGLGGVCLFGSNLARGAGSSADVDAAATPPAAGASADAGVRAAANVSGVLHGVRPSLVVALDEEGGDVTRLDAHVGSPVPGNAALGAVDDAALTRRLAHGLGLRLVEAGVDLDLAPCADANTDPANPVIGVRSFGADPALVARHVAAFVEGLQTAGVAACAKHFPGHGATTVDSHLDLPVVDAPAPVLRTRELVPFRAAIAAGTSTVMLGHLRMPAFDDVPATISHRIVTGLLRDELGFGGAVVTDALDMHGIGGPPAIPANVVRAVAAGVDLCCLGSGGTDELIGACIDALVGAVRRGALDEARLADAAGRVAAISRRWLHTPKAVPPALAELGADAAHRALRVSGEIPGPIGPAHVVELRSVPNIAAGVVPWGVADPLSTLVPGTTAEQLDPTAPTDSPHTAGTTGTTGTVRPPGTDRSSDAAQLDPHAATRDVVAPPSAAASTGSDGSTDVPGVADGVGGVLARAAGRRLVVVLRDGRRPAAAALASALVEARPDAVVVDMGWPSDLAAGPSGVRVSTYGASRASGESVARLLAGRDASTSMSASTSAATVATSATAGRSPRG